MLIYEKDNKLNISFENNMDETDIVVGKDEVKIGESIISENNVLPVPEEGDAGKVPTVQEDGSYALANAQSGGGAFIVHRDNNNIDALDKTWQEIFDASKTDVVLLVYYEAIEHSAVIHYLYCAVMDGKSGEYIVEFFNPNGSTLSTYISSTSNGYPSYHD